MTYPLRQFIAQNLPPLRLRAYEKKTLQEIRAFPGIRREKGLCVTKIAKAKVAKEDPSKVPKWIYLSENEEREFSNDQPLRLDHYQTWSEETCKANTAFLCKVRYDKIFC